jgi:acetylornithine deacetylase/succinyl-diaminopimelate desuccinylase-like protein
MTTTARRLQDHVESLTAHGPRHARTNPDALPAARAYAVAKLVEDGWDVAEIPFRTGPTLIADVQADSRNPFPIRLTRGLGGVNVIATRPGATGPFLMIGAHIDTVAGSTGADDNGSGVAAVLELAARDEVQDGNVMLALFDAEESGQQGLPRSRASSAMS